MVMPIERGRNTSELITTGEQCREAIKNVVRIAIERSRNCDIQKGALKLFLHDPLASSVFEVTTYGVRREGENIRMEGDPHSGLEIEGLHYGKEPIILDSLALPRDPELSHETVLDLSDVSPLALQSLANSLQNATTLNEAEYSKFWTSQQQ